MTTTTDGHRTNVSAADEILRRIDDVGGVLDEHGAACEAAGRLHDASIAALVDANVFRTWLPTELGGSGATLAQAIQIIARIAYYDTSSAWNAGVWTIGSGFAGAYLGDSAVAEVFAADQPLVAGQTAPMGTARAVDGGYLISGDWAFGSGVRHASWVKSGVRVDRGHGRSDSLLAVVPVDDVTIDGTSWDVAALAGSGSFDYSMRDVFVADHFTFEFPVAAPRRGGMTYALPLPAQVAILHAGFAIGAARRCLDEILELVRMKVRAFDTDPLARRATFRSLLAEHQLRLTAAESLVMDTAQRLQASAGGTEVLERTLEMRAATRYVTDVALDVATWAYRTGGGTALRRPHPLQRCQRDLLGATQHIYVDEQALTDFGASLVGEETLPQ